MISPEGLTEQELIDLADPHQRGEAMTRADKHRLVTQAADALERSPGLWFRFYGPWQPQSRGAHQAASHLRLGQRYGAQLGGRRLQFRVTMWRGHWWIYARHNPDAEPIPAGN